MAEWLRRLTWNQMGSSRAGSNPADCEDILPFFGNICRLFRIHAPLAYIKQVVYSFVMQSWPSGKGVWLEIRWDLPAQVRILLTASTFCLFRKHLLMIRDTCTIGIYLTNFLLICYHAVIAEWLRRLTRNQMGCSRAGSNPADCEDILPFFGNICRLFRIHAPLAYIKQVFYPFVYHAVMAESLRRLTRNQMGSFRAGSNPTDREYILPFFGNIYWWFMIYARLTYITQDFYSYC